VVPDGTVKADELALDFDTFAQAYLGNFRDEISPSQRDALLALVAARLESVTPRTDHARNR
jgi:hypothetical protein